VQKSSSTKHFNITFQAKW